MNDNKIKKVSDNVSWIGVYDADIRYFDIVMETKFGTSYNSYLINTDKKVIIDSTKQKFWDDYKSNIESATKFEDIEFIVVNHTEYDHSGNMKNLLKLAKNAKVVGSNSAIRFLKEQLNEEFNSIIVKDNQHIDLGNDRLHFISAPNLHWPDTIFSYLESEKILFTCDAFGSHYCSDKLFEEEVENYEESFKYYFDLILKPYSKFMLKAIEKIRNIGEIKMVCPSHGPILRKNLQKYVNLSENMAYKYLNATNEPMVMVGYVSAYDNTKLIAEKIAEGLKAEKIKYNLVDLQFMEAEAISDIIEKSTGIIIGSPTINQNTLLPIYKVMAAINPIRDRTKLAGVFGSYGWSGEALQIIENGLKQLKLNLVENNMSVNFTPSITEQQKAIEYGKVFAEKLRSINKDIQ